MRSLLMYYIKKRAYIVGIISVIFIIIALINFSSGFINYDNTPGTAPIGNITTLGCLLATIIPIFEFNFKMRKVSVDEFYKYPIKKEKLYFVKFVVGFLEIIISITVLFIFLLIYMNIKTHLFDMKYYFLFYLLFVINILFIYAILSFAFIKANTTIDGVVNMMLYIFLFVLIMGMIIQILGMIPSLEKSALLKTIPIDYLLYVPISEIANLFAYAMRGYELDIKAYQIIPIVVIAIAGILSIFLMFFTLKYEESEDSMDISSSWFSYKTMIPIYLVTLIYFFRPSFPGVVFFTILAYIGYVIFRRSFLIKKIDIIVCVSSAVLGVLLCVML